MPKRIPCLWPTSCESSRLYLIGWKSGVIKIGQSTRPRERLKTHRATYGKDIEWAHLFGPDTGRHEYGSMRDFRDLGANSKSRLAESFTGITKEVAMSICRDRIRRWREDLLKLEEHRRLRDADDAARQAFKAQMKSKIEDSRSAQAA